MDLCMFEQNMYLKKIKDSQKAEIEWRMKL